MSLRQVSHAEAQQIAVRNFFIHLAIYLVVNAGLIALNLNNSPDRLWFYWPLAGWGLGIVLHAVAVFVTGRAADHVQDRRERMSDRE